MMNALVNINGRICDPEEAKISVFDRGFLFGDGVYETGKALDGCCLFLEEHLKRLRRSANKLQIPVPLSDEKLTEELFRTARAFGRKDAYFRIVLSRGVGASLGLESFKEFKPTLVIIFQPLSEKLDFLRAHGIKLLTSTVVRNSSAAQDPNIKTSNYLNSLLALQEVQARGGEDAVLCDSSGNVTEGTTFSIFGVENGKTLLTASLEVGILDSITRRYVLELGSKFLKVEEGFIPLERFKNCEAVFIASSVREIVPVREWDEKKYNLPDSTTEKLKLDLKTEIRTYIREHVKYL
ncbi:branched-chain amino acid aminotransferase [bacterium]|nr:branched-chain amino acid aminotransferase [bacterium]